eukprot:GGOE01020652.1.p1 GENE.GGOE01020652.1~~GGOE01020652.1.p1  ORF type:complete len:490 (-),score=110.60 GGOE01020652.1:266-1735(-)
MAPFLWLLILLFAAAGEKHSRPAPQAILHNVTRIVFTGDSIARGLMMNNMAARFSTRFVMWLQQDTGRSIIEINKGETGWALVDRHNFYMERGMTIGQWILTLEPDAVVVEWGANDHFWGYQEDEYLACYHLLLKDLRSARPSMPIAVMTMVPDWRFPNKHLSPEQKRRAWPNGLDPIWSERAHAGVQELAVQFGCHVAHVHKAYDHKASLQKDLVHPHEHGHLVIATELYEAFARPALGPDAAHFVTDLHNQTLRFLGFSIEAHGVPIHQQRWAEFHNVTVRGFEVWTSVPLTIGTPPILLPESAVRVYGVARDGHPVELLRAAVPSSGSIVFNVAADNDAAALPSRLQIVIDGSFSTTQLQIPDYSFDNIRTGGNRVAFNFSSVVTKRLRRPRPGTRRRVSPGPTESKPTVEDTGAEGDESGGSVDNEAGNNSTAVFLSNDAAIGQSSYLSILLLGLFFLNTFTLFRLRGRGRRTARERPACHEPSP